MRFHSEAPAERTAQGQWGWGEVCRWSAQCCVLGALSAVTEDGAEKVTGHRDIIVTCRKHLVLRVKHWTDSGWQVRWPLGSHPRR